MTCEHDNPTEIKGTLRRHWCPDCGAIGHGHVESGKIRWTVPLGGSNRRTDRDREGESHLGAAKALARIGLMMLEESGEDSDSGTRMFCAAKCLDHAAKHAGAGALVRREREREAGR